MDPAAFDGVAFGTLAGGVSIPRLAYCVSARSTHDADHLVTAAIESGYRNIDATSSPDFAEAIGRGMRASSCPRDQLFLVAGARPLTHLLSRLTVDYVDLYVADVTDLVDSTLVDAWGAALDAVASGQARAAGVRGATIDQLHGLARHFDTLPAVNQIEIDPISPHDDELLGLTRLKVAAAALKPMGDWRALLALPEVRALSMATKHTEAQVLIRWHLQRGTIPLTSPVHAERIASNARVFDFELAPDQMRQLDSLSRTAGSPSEQQ